MVVIGDSSHELDFVFVVLLRCAPTSFYYFKLSSLRVYCLGSIIDIMTIFRIVGGLTVVLVREVFFKESLWLSVWCKIVSLSDGNCIFMCDQKKSGCPLSK